jgi:hypothetical protein
MRLIDVGDDVSRTVTLCTQAYRDALEGQYKTLFDIVRRRHAVL